MSISSLPSPTLRDRSPACSLRLLTHSPPTDRAPRCCACPETKKARDDCFLKYGSNVDDDGESSAKCRDIVEKHRECMRSYGFNV